MVYRNITVAITVSWGEIYINWLTCGKSLYFISHLEVGEIMTNLKAVIPVAGLGMHMLPATKAIPKEMLPIVDKPMIQYIVDEIVAAGIKRNRTGDSRV